MAGFRRSFASKKKTEKETEVPVENAKEVDPIVDALPENLVPEPSKPRKKKPVEESKVLVNIGRETPPDYPTLIPISFTGTPMLPQLPPSMMLVLKDDAKLTEAITTLCNKKHGYVGLFMRKDIDEDSGSSIETQPSNPLIRKSEYSHVDNLEEIHSVGVLGQVISHEYIRNGGLQVLIRPIRRIAATEWRQQKPIPLLHVQHFHDQKKTEIPPEDEKQVQAYMSELSSLIREIGSRKAYADMGPNMVNMNSFNLSNTTPGVAADFGTMFCNVTKTDTQDMLDRINVLDRLSKAVFLLRKELEVVKIQVEIGEQLSKQFNEKQKQHVMMEQYKELRRQLGFDKDEKQALVDKYKERIENKKLHPDVQRVIDEELDKLNHLEPSSSEYSVCRNYLDWLTVLPWETKEDEQGDVTEAMESVSIKSASEILDADHYGMQDVKDRILEFIAVGKMLGEHPKGRILCFLGPPGVGKTSIGKSIAKAIDREFYRFSVGGMSDVAEIKGHRRTYVGAMPGKLIQGLKQVGTMDPVMLIDEIDKLGHGSGFRGDPSSALLEVLDPEQNSSFNDHYLDVPVDLSKVLFICTANEEDTIPGPLADRMEFINLSGYILQEKVEIAKRYLAPVAQKASGVSEDQLVVTDAALEKLIKEYCREAGVRSLEKEIQKIHRKCALMIVREELTSSDFPYHITEENLHKFVGLPKFRSDRLYASPAPPGIVAGLAWSAMGGSTLFIEASADPSVKKDGDQKGSFHVTGRLGEVIKESSDIAFSVAKSVLHRIDPDNRFLQQNHIHMHLPAGATKKDGPSAGIAMVCSLVSLATNTPLVDDIAMTGEVSLTGKVMAIGGVREKTVAARRSGMKKLLFPLDNESDFQELPDFLKEGLDVHFVDSYDQVLELAFDGLKYH